MNAIGSEMAEQPSRDQLPDTRRRWGALIGLCGGVFLSMLEGTIVSVALPFIRKDLKAPETSLVWVINAYSLAFGGFLLLSGRLGDFYGHRRLFLIGILLFTAASLVCGLAGTESQLIAARAVQGLGGALIEATALSQVATMFPAGAERAKALGVYSFVCAGAVSVGLVLGGMLTSAFNWRWVFFINLPIGIIVWGWCFSLIPKGRIGGAVARPDFLGAGVGTASLIFALFVVGDAHEAEWLFSPEALLLMAAAAVGFALFFYIEVRVPAPLLALRIFRIRNLAAANAMAICVAACYGTWLVLSALHMERVLGYGPMQIGLSLLPQNLITSVLLLGLSAKLVNRFGVVRPLRFGLVLVVIAVGLLVREPTGANPWLDILPSTILLGVGMGIAYNPLLLAAMDGVDPSDDGLASGIINTSFVLGGTLGLAAASSLSSMRAEALLSAGASVRAAWNGGYHVGMTLAACCAGVAVMIGIAFLKGK